MARRPPLSASGIAMHVVQRGNNRATCFYQRSAYKQYLDWLAQFSVETECRVHAYVLMTNHVHLLLTPAGEAGASRLMKQVSQHYTQYVNRVHRRTGTLWEGRFKSCLVQSEHYALACYRYIELNPVRAGLVAAPENYAWSSFRTNADGHRSKLVTHHPAYVALGATPPERQSAYRSLFATVLDAEVLGAIRGATAGNYALGDLRFQLDVEGAIGLRARRGAPGRPPGAKNVV